MSDGGRIRKLDMLQPGMSALLHGPQLAALQFVNGSACAVMHVQIEAAAQDGSHPRGLCAL